MSYDYGTQIMYEERAERENKIQWMKAWLGAIGIVLFSYFVIFPLVL